MQAESSGDILERHPFDADETDIALQGVVKSVDCFLQKYHHKGEPVAISLSGGQRSDSVCDKDLLVFNVSVGVDSMVIAKILKVLQEKREIPRLIAIHIDYANRSESNAEACFVESWSQGLGFEFHKRVVNEVTRGITDRAEYEKVSRDIRYSFYQTVLSESGCGGVIFGHHQGDVQENVISNVMR